MRPLFLFVSLVWAVEADPRDKEILKDLEFFESYEVMETMPLLTDFGQVLDEINQDQQNETGVETGVKEPR